MGNICSLTRTVNFLEI